METKLLAMAPRRFTCLTPGCRFETEELEASYAIEFLKLHTSQNHGITSKARKTLEASEEYLSCKIYISSRQAIADGLALDP